MKLLHFVPFPYQRLWASRLSSRKPSTLFAPRQCSDLKFGIKSLQLCLWVQLDIQRKHIHKAALVRLLGFLLFFQIDARGMMVSNSCRILYHCTTMPMMHRSSILQRRRSSFPLAAWANRAQHVYWVISINRATPNFATFLHYGDRLPNVPLILGNPQSSSESRLSMSAQP